ncbi:MAG: 2-hydroxyacyl-CoA dehydratase family protein [Lachnospiraceae bacterium]|nr:2-hydroxyacyl-CoA dehydratase family protein [Lachnospiraceae bacterium]
MNERIEKLGAAISAQTDKNPDRAAQMLSLTYRALGTGAKHFPPKKLTASRSYLQAYTADLLAGMLRDPSHSAVVNIFMPSEIFSALDMPITAPEALAAYVVNTACERVFIEKAEEQGAPETYCSYHKVLTGMAEAGVMKAPAMIANTALACDANQLSFRRLAELWKVPHVLIDVPLHVDEDAVDYVAAELRGLAHVAEECAGKKLDPDRLRQCVARSDAQLRNYRKYLQRRPSVHLPEALTPELLNAVCNHLYLGTEEGLNYSRLLLEDVAKAPARGPERHILWMHVLPNWQTSVKEIFQGEDNHRVEIVGCDLAYSSLTRMDPDKPYESMARRLVYDSFNGPGSRRIEATLQLARKMKVDGILIFCQWGCKQTQGLAYTAKRAFEAEGFPTLVLDGDACDRTNSGSGQLVTRANAFVEQLEAAALH